MPRSYGGARIARSVLECASPLALLGAGKPRNTPNTQTRFRFPFSCGPWLNHRRIRGRAAANPPARPRCRWKAPSNIRRLFWMRRRESAIEFLLFFLWQIFEQLFVRDASPKIELRNLANPYICNFHPSGPKLAHLRFGNFKIFPN